MSIAISGTGWAGKVHAKAVRCIPGAELVAVVNHRPESRQSFACSFGIKRQYADVESLLAEGDVDALIVATPNYLHAPQAVAALEAGVHVMVEKPMAMNAAEAAQMTQAAKGSGAALMVAYCFRFDPEVRWLRDQIVEGRLGRVIRTAGYGVHVGWGPSAWFAEKRHAGGGALVDMGVHAIDTARFLLGDPRPESVYAHVGTCYKELEVEDTAISFITWEGGVTSYVEAGWWQPHADGPCAATRVYGTLGFGQVFPTELSLPHVGDGGTLPGADGSVSERVQPAFSVLRDGHPPQSVYDAQMAHFLSCIREHHQPSPGGDDGLVSMRIMDAAYGSAQSGEVVRL